MPLVQAEKETIAIQFGRTCFLAASQWETDSLAEEDQVSAWRADQVGPIGVKWQAAKPRIREAEVAYPLMLAAMRAVVHKTRRLPPFVVVVDLSTAGQSYIEVARIDEVGITQQTALASRSPGSIARAIELLTTDDAEPIFYLGNRGFPATDESRLGSLVLPLANHPATLETLLLSGYNPQTALRLVLLTARQQTAALAVFGVGLWLWSAGQWLQVQENVDRYGPGLLQAELQPLKSQLRQLRTEQAALAGEFSRAEALHLPGARTADMLRRAVSPGAQIRQIKLADRRKLNLLLTGKPGPVLETLGRLAGIGRMGDLHFSVRPATAAEDVSVPVEIELGQKRGRHG